MPHNPQGFFGLEGEFDRRELKRAYGKLIRQFKPESHPNEFQRIRAAYEELESFLRYGQSQQNTAATRQAWNMGTLDSKSKSVRDDQAASAQIHSSGNTSPQTVVERALANPLATYQSLLAQSSRSPQEYYILAVLSDLIDPHVRQSTFVECLLLGLKSHPDDIGLQSLIQQYMRSEVSLQEAPSILYQVAAATRSPAFYRMTESVWENLLRETGFDAFLTLLTKCETEIRQTDDSARNAFYLRILRTAVWTAPRQWTCMTIDELESQATTLQPYLLQELEFVTMLRDYLTTTSQTLSHYEARTRLQRFLYHFCTSDGPAATVAMTRELSQIAREANSMRAAFPVLSERDESPLFMLMYMATDELQQSSGMGFDVVDEDQNNVLARVLLEDLQPSQQVIISALNSLNFQYRWLTFFAGLALSIVASIVGGAMSVGISNNTAVPLVVMLGIPVAFTIVYFAWLAPKRLEPMLDRAQGKRWWQLYEEHWRERVFRYIQSCSEPPSVALERVVTIGRLRRQEDWAGLVQRFATNDIGLLIFGQTQAFVV